MVNVAQEIYDTLIKHCGDIKSVKGVTEQSLKLMRDGKHFPTIPYLKKLFEANELKAEITLKVKPSKGTGKTNIKML